MPLLQGHWGSPPSPLHARPSDWWRFDLTAPNRTQPLPEWAKSPAVRRRNAMASGSSSNNSSSNGGGGGGSGRLGMPLLTHPKEQPRPTAVPLSSPSDGFPKLGPATVQSPWSSSNAGSNGSRRMSTPSSGSTDVSRNSLPGRHSSSSNGRSGSILADTRRYSSSGSGSTGPAVAGVFTALRPSSDGSSVSRPFLFGYRSSSSSNSKCSSKASQTHAAAQTDAAEAAATVSTAVQTEHRACVSALRQRRQTPAPAAASVQAGSTRAGGRHRERLAEFNASLAAAEVRRAELRQKLAAARAQQALEQADPAAAAAATAKAMQQQEAPVAAAAAAAAAATTAETGCQTDLAHLSPATSTALVGQAAEPRGRVGHSQKEKARLVGKVSKLRVQLGQREGQLLAAEASRGSLEGRVQSLKAQLQCKSAQVNELSALLLMAATDNCQDNQQATATATAAVAAASQARSASRSAWGKISAGIMFSTCLLLVGLACFGLGVYAGSHSSSRHQSAACAVGAFSKQAAPVRATASLQQYANTTSATLLTNGHVGRSSSVLAVNPFSGSTSWYADSLGAVLTGYLVTHLTDNSSSSSRGNSADSSAAAGVLLRQRWMDDSCGVDWSSDWPSVLNSSSTAGASAASAVLPVPAAAAATYSSNSSSLLLATSRDNRNSDWVSHRALFAHVDTAILTCPATALQFSPPAAATNSSSTVVVLASSSTAVAVEAGQCLSNATGVQWTSGVPPAAAAAAAAAAGEVAPECSRNLTSLWQVVQDHKQQQQQQVVVAGTIATVSQEVPAAGAAAVGALREAHSSELSSEAPFDVREALVPASALAALVLQVRLVYALGHQWSPLPGRSAQRTAAATTGVWGGDHCAGVLWDVRVKQEQHQPQSQTLTGQCLCVRLPAGATPGTLHAHSF